MKTRFMVVGLAFSLLTPALALAEDSPAKKKLDGLLQKEAGTTSDDDDDLLDGDLDEEDTSRSKKTPAKGAKGLDPKIQVPPAAVKAKIDARIKELVASGEAIDQELFVELKDMLNSDDEAQRAGAQKEIEKRLAASEKKLANLKAQVNTLGSSGSTRASGPASYGTPVKPVGKTAYERYRIGSAHPQFQWWQGNLDKSQSGVEGGLQKLAEKRTNELKAEADKLSLDTDAQYRPYVDAMVQKELGQSAYGKRLGAINSDRRVNDLFLQKKVVKKTYPTRPIKKKVVRRTQTFDSGQTVVGNVRDFMLPRKKDFNGNTRLVVNIPLGEPLKTK